jgi:molybdopterin-guanine dinucleotide biosynthesis adapter protein
MSGHRSYGRPVVQALFQESFSKRPDRRHFLRGVLTREDGVFMVRTTGAQGSGILTSMVKANCLIDIPVEVERVSLGDLVSVQLLSGVAWASPTDSSHTSGHHQSCCWQKGGHWSSVISQAGGALAISAGQWRLTGFIMGIPIVAFVGRSNSGKTTLIERVIPELVRAGYKVATVKHTGHGFDLDTEGKDSWRHKRAGASSVVVLSKGSMAMFADVSDQMRVEDVRDRFLDHTYDLIIAEGWKHERYPKIIVVREQVGEIPVSTEGLLAVVSDKPVDLHVPLFGLDDVVGVAALIMKQFPRSQARSEQGLEA